MNFRFNKSTKTKINKECDAVFERMSRPDISDEEWRELNKRYQAYTEMLKPTWSISPDTILVVAGNLLGIVLILKHEKLDIITSKALGFVLRGRV